MVLWAKHVIGNGYPLQPLLVKNIQVWIKQTPPQHVQFGWLKVLLLVQKNQAHPSFSSLQPGSWGRMHLGVHRVLGALQRPHIPSRIQMATSAEALTIIFKNATLLWRRKKNDRLKPPILGALSGHDYIQVLNREWPTPAVPFTKNDPAFLDCLQGSNEQLGKFNNFCKSN